jgi:hypothetical protein
VSSLHCDGSCGPRRHLLTQTSPLDPARRAGQTRARPSLHELTPSLRKRIHCDRPLVLYPKIQGRHPR